jgi:hypothetical protein
MDIKRSGTRQSSIGPDGAAEFGGLFELNVLTEDFLFCGNVFH